MRFLHTYRSDIHFLHACISVICFLHTCRSDICFLHAYRSDAHSEGPESGCQAVWQALYTRSHSYASRLHVLKAPLFPIWAQCKHVDPWVTFSCVYTLALLSKLMCGFLVLAPWMGRQDLTWLMKIIIDPCRRNVTTSEAHCPGSQNSSSGLDLLMDLCEILWSWSYSKLWAACHGCWVIRPISLILEITFKIKYLIAMVNITKIPITNIIYISTIFKFYWDIIELMLFISRAYIFVNI